MHQSGIGPGKPRHFSALGDGYTQGQGNYSGLADAKTDAGKRTRTEEKMHTYRQKGNSET